jgi:hypothetical protein
LHHTGPYQCGATIRRSAMEKLQTLLRTEKN